MTRTNNEMKVLYFDKVKRNTNEAIVCAKTIEECETVLTKSLYGEKARGRVVVLDIIEQHEVKRYMPDNVWYENSVVIEIDGKGIAKN